MDSGLWKAPPVDTILSQPVLVQNMWGISSPSKINLGGEWVESPKMSIELEYCIYNFYRHPALFTSVRVERFLSEYWYNVNTKQNKSYENISGWENSARRLYANCYNVAQKKAKEIDGNG